MNNASPTLPTYSDSSFLWFEATGLVVGLCLAIFAAAMLLRAALSDRNPRLERILAGGASASIIAGLIGAFYVFAFPPLHHDANGNLIGEMPPEFGFCGGLLWIGLSGALCVLASKGIRRLRAPRPAR